jgi:hypothetical protein
VLKKKAWLILVFAFSCVGRLDAYDIPPKIYQWLQDNNQTRILDRIEKIQSLNVSSFITTFIEADPKFLDAGCNGLIFTDKNGRIWKISIAIAEAMDLIEITPNNNRIDDQEKARLKEDWKKIRESAAFMSLGPFLQQRIQEGWPHHNEEIGREILGAATWGVYSPIDVNIPDLVAVDRYGFRDDFIEGPTFYEVLKAQKTSGTPYDTQKLWKEFASLQRANELMLIETGMAADLFSPRNLKVRGGVSNAYLYPFDLGLSHPEPAITEWFVTQGLALPAPLFSGETQITERLIISAQVVSHILWKLTYEQSLEYIQAYFGTETLEQAKIKLAQIHEWAHRNYPKAMAHENIQRARRETGIVPSSAPKIADNLNLIALLKKCLDRKVFQ